MKSIVYKTVLKFQYLLLLVTYYLIKPFVKKDNETWVVGVEEIATVLVNMANALPKSVSVNLLEHPFYNFKYNYALKNRSNFKLIIFGPLLFAYLTAKYERFIYIGAKGFLLHLGDARELEFFFLNKKNKKLICYFTGSEIRSFILLDEYGKRNDIDVITTYQRYVSPSLGSNASEKFRKNLATVAEKYALEIFNPPVDQMSYFKRATHPCLYFCPDSLFNKNNEKFLSMDIVKIVHAPSSPIIKGTPLVRAAIKKLKMEGYKINYVELIGMSNDHVLEELRSAHIVLNQFYAFIPSIFGVEALAAHTALLTSADEYIEVSLDKGANSAWYVTPYWMVYDNLKELLDNPEKIKKQADRGFEWCKNNCSAKVGGKKLLDILIRND